MNRFAERAWACRQESRPPQGQVGQNGLIDLHVGVFVDHPHADAEVPGRIQEWGARLIQFANQFRPIAARRRSDPGGAVLRRDAFRATEDAGLGDDLLG